MSKILPFSFMKQPTVGGGGFGNGADGALVILNGQTVNLAAGSIKQYTSVDVQLGGTLNITGNQPATITQLYSQGAFIVNGQIVARDVSTNGYNISGNTLFGYPYSINSVQRLGGNGGRSGNIAPNNVFTSGGTSNTTSGGGGGGAGSGWLRTDEGDFNYTYRHGGAGGNAGSNGGLGIYDATIAAGTSSCYQPGWDEASPGTGGAGNANYAANGSSSVGTAQQANGAVLGRCFGAAGAGGGGGGIKYSGSVGFKPITCSFQYGAGGGGGGGRGKHGAPLFIGATAITGSGTIDTSGRAGFNGSNAGISINAPVDSLTRAGGGGGGAGGNGGNLYLQVGSYTCATIVTGGAGGAGGSFSGGNWPVNSINHANGATGLTGLAGSVVVI